MHHLLLLAILLLSLLSAHAYEVIECYWARGQMLPLDSPPQTNSYIPCGEISEGVQSCCRVGHTCLATNACYAPEAGMVYTAGCTDDDYADSKCPTKCEIAAYWVGHSYCNGTSNQWSCCPNQYGSPNNRQEFPINNRQRCWCPEEDAMIAFSAPSKIPDVAYLDLSTPGSISYFPGHAPSTTADDSSTTSSSAATSPEADSSTTSESDTARITRMPSGSSPTTNSPASSTASLSDDSSASQNLSPGATSSPSTATSDPGISTSSKIGIGVGVGAGALVLAALLWFLLNFLRKRRQGPPPPIEDQIRPKSFGSYAGFSGANSSEGPNGDLRSPAWSGHKSELPADENVVSSPRIMSMNSSMAEVEGSTPRQSVQSQPSVQSMQAQPLRPNDPLHPVFDSNQVRQYQPYRPPQGPNMQSIQEMPG